MLLMLVAASPVCAGEYCQWTGTTRENCKSDGGRGYVMLPNGVYVSAKDYAEYGYYPLVVTQPEPTADQKLGDEIEEFNGSEITLTWDVVNLTAQEILLRDAAPMPLTDYHQWLAIQTLGGWTNQQMSNVLSAEEVAAFLARKTLEEQ